MSYWARKTAGTLNKKAEIKNNLPSWFTKRFLGMGRTYNGPQARLANRLLIGITVD
jgi:hypothetical protein